MLNVQELYQWSPDSLLEIELDEPDSFLKIKETLTRIGVAANKDTILFQSCHILHKRGRYYCVMFKELFHLDGKPTNITVEDISRRNTIAALLEQWGLCKIKANEGFEAYRVPVSAIKIVAHKDKKNWDLRSKYSMRSERRSVARII